MLEQHSNTNGKSNRFPEGKYLIDTNATLIRQNYRFCETNSLSGSDRCQFLSSARSRWQTFIPNLADEMRKVNAEDSAALKTGVSLGLLTGVKIIAGCQECGRHITLSTTLSIELIEALLWRNLVLKHPEGIFITWRLEIGNSYQRGLWGTLG